MRKLLEPLKVGNMELRNRVILSAMAKYFCTNGFIGQEYIEYYRTIAHGGTALIMQLAENGIVLNVSRSITQSPR